MGIIINGLTDTVTAADGSLNIGGDVTIPGELSYDDVTNIDSVGIITAQAGVKVPDNQTIFLGTGNDLQIYHNGSHSYISESSGTGDLRLVSSRTLIRDENDANHCIIANSGGSVDLYHNGSKKFETTSGGANVTGDFIFGANSKAKLFENGTQSGVQATNSTSSAHLMTHDGNEDIHVDPSGYIKVEVAGSERARITSNGNVAIGTDTTDRQLAIYHDTQATIELKSSDTGQSSLWFTDLSDGNIGGVYYTHNNNKMVLRVSDAARMTITGIGSVGIGEENPINRLHVEDSGVSISSTGDAILNSTQKGIRLINSNNNDTSLGLWFTTGESHHAGISGQRTDSASHWGTDLRFYTHEGATNDLTYTRERLRICCNGLLTNRKGNNAINTGGTILGRYKYTQQNQSQNYEHVILGPDGRKLQDFVDSNCFCIITVCVTGTGSSNMFCQYHYYANQSSSSSTLNHIAGNNSASSNRPYMLLVNTHDPAWKMNHSGGYTQDIEVAIYGGNDQYTYTNQFGKFGANP